MVTWLKHQIVFYVFLSIAGSFHLGDKGQMALLSHHTNLIYGIFNTVLGFVHPFLPKKAVMAHKLWWFSKHWNEFQSKFVSLQWICIPQVSDDHHDDQCMSERCLLPNLAPTNACSFTHPHIEKQQNCYSKLIKKRKWFKDFTQCLGCNNDMEALEG